MINKTKTISILKTVIIGVVGGAIFFLINLPLAWMLGPLTGVLFWKLLIEQELQWPISFRNGGQMALGYTMGLSFTSESAGQIIQQFPSMLICTVLMVTFGLFMARLISKFTGMRLPSAVMGTTPGGLSQMVLLSEEIKDADPTIVTFMQTIRMLLVIFLVPTLTINALSMTNRGYQSPLNGEWFHLSGEKFIPLFLILMTVLLSTKLAVRLNCPTPWIIGPLLSSAILTVCGVSAPQLPEIFTIMAQVCLGIYLGNGMKSSMLGKWKTLLPLTVISSLLVLGFALSLAYVLHKIYSISLTTAFLCIAPGGLPEMGVTARIVNADVSMVAAFQLFRVFFILFIIPIFLTKIFGREINDKTASSTS